jgi:hypothetical protein
MPRSRKANDLSAGKKRAMKGGRKEETVFFALESRERKPKNKELLPRTKLYEPIRWPILSLKCSALGSRGF